MLLQETDLTRVKCRNIFLLISVHRTGSRDSQRDLQKWWIWKIWEQQISGAVGILYADRLCPLYGSAVGQAIQSQISSAMQQVMGQLASGMENAMKQGNVPGGEAAFRMHFQVQ